MKHKKIKKRKQTFGSWLIMLFMSFFVQALGNTHIPELHNFGLVIAILFLITVLMDLHNLILNKKWQ